MGWNLAMLLLFVTLFLNNLATRLEWDSPSTATTTLQEDAETTEEALARASKLRDGSSADWQAKRYRNADEKLAEGVRLIATPLEESNTSRACTWVTRPVHAESDADGHYRLPLRGSSEYRLEAEDPADRWANVLREQVGPGQRVDLPLHPLTPR